MTRRGGHMQAASQSSDGPSTRRIAVEGAAEELVLLTACGPHGSPARTRPPQRRPLRIAAVQQRWHPDPEVHVAALEAGIRLAAAQDAEVVCLQELTLSPYFAVDPAGPAAGGV